MRGAVVPERDRDVGVAVDVTVAELHIEPFFAADAAAAQAAVWIAMRAAVVAGLAALQSSRAWRRSSFVCLRPASGWWRVGARPHDLGRGVVRY
jgi:hypothetical protein